MGVLKINLDTLLSKYIHRPIIKTENLPPLYARTSNESESQSDIEGMKNALWQKAVQENYNSPTNIRRLFIGDREIHIQYYQPIISQGVSAGHYWASYKYKENEYLDEFVKNILYYSRLAVDAERLGQEAPDRISVSKTGFGALSNNWKVSNIEELYITPSILVSQDISSQFAEAANTLKAFLSKPVGMLLKGDLPSRIFEYANGANITDIRTRYPRLRTIAFMTNIEKAFVLPDSTRLADGVPKTLEDVSMTWIGFMGKRGVSNISSIMVNNLSFENGTAYLDFALRPGIYKFDNEILTHFVERYKEKVLNLGRAQRDGDRAEGTSNSKSEYEKYLDQLYLTCGEGIVRAALQLTFARITTNAIDAEFNLMSSEGKQKYRKLLGR